MFLNFCFSDFPSVLKKWSPYGMWAAQTKHKAISPRRWPQNYKQFQVALPSAHSSALLPKHAYLCTLGSHDGHKRALHIVRRWPGFGQIWGDAAEIGQICLGIGEVWGEFGDAGPEFCQT